MKIFGRNKNDESTITVEYVLKTGQRFISRLAKNHQFSPTCLTATTIHYFPVDGKKVFVQGDNIAYIRVVKG